MSVQLTPEERKKLREKYAGDDSLDTIVSVPYTSTPSAKTKSGNKSYTDVVTSVPYSKNGLYSISSDSFGRYNNEYKTWSKTGKHSSDYSSWYDPDELSVFNSINSGKGKTAIGSDGTRYYMSDDDYGKYGSEYSTWSSTGNHSDDYASWYTPEGLSAYNAIHNTGNYAIDDWSYTLDPEIVDTVRNNYKGKFGTTYYYDTTDPEDMARMSRGEMPKYAEKKYNMNDPYDAWLYKNGLPPLKTFSDMYSDAVVDYNENVAKANAKYAKEAAAEEEKLNGYNTTYNGIYSFVNAASEQMPKMVDALENGATWEEIRDSGLYDEALSLYVKPVSKKDNPTTSEILSGTKDQFEYTGENKDIYESAWESMQKGESPSEDFFKVFNQASWDKFMLSKLGWNEEDASRWYSSDDESVTPSLNTSEKKGTLKKITENANGSMDLTQVQPIVSSSEMKDAGWNVKEGLYFVLNSEIFKNDDGSATLVSSIYEDDSGNAEILSPEKLDDYVKNYMETGEDPLGIVVGNYDSTNEAREAKEEIDSATTAIYGLDNPEAITASAAEAYEKNKEIAISQDTTGCVAPYFACADAYEVLKEKKANLEAAKKGKNKKLEDIAQAEYDEAYAVYTEASIAFNKANIAYKEAVLSGADPERLDAYMLALDEYDKAYDAYNRSKGYEEYADAELNIKTRPSYDPEKKKALEEAEAALSEFDDLIFDLNPIDGEENGERLSRVNTELSKSLVTVAKLENFGESIDEPTEAELYSRPEDGFRPLAKGNNKDKAASAMWLYKILTSTDGENIAPELLNASLDVSGLNLDKVKETISIMSDAQKRAYISLVNEGRYDEALECFIALDRISATHLMEEKQRAWYEFGQEHPILSWVGTWGLLSSQIGRAVEGVSNAFNFLSGDRSYIDTMYESPTTARTAQFRTAANDRITEKYKHNPGKAKVLNFLYGTATSILENVARIPLALPIPGSGAASYLAGSLSLGVMGAEVFNDTYYSSLASGKGIERAFVDGIAAASIEVVTESYSLSSFLEKWNAGTLAKGVLKQGAEEFGEELTASILNDLYDIAMNGELSEYREQAEAWLAENPERFKNLTQEERIEWAELLFAAEAAGMDAVGGFLSGVATGGLSYLKTVKNTGGFSNLNYARNNFAKGTAEQTAAAMASVSELNVSPEFKQQAADAIDTMLTTPQNLATEGYAEMAESIQAAFSNDFARSAIASAVAQNIAEGVTVVDVNKLVSDPTIQAAAEATGATAKEVIQFLNSEAKASAVEVQADLNERMSRDSKYNSLFQKASQIGDALKSALKGKDTAGAAKLCEEYKTAIEKATEQKQSNEGSDALAEKKNAVKQAEHESKLTKYFEANAEARASLDAAVKAFVETSVKSGKVTSKGNNEARNILRGAINEYLSKPNISDKAKADAQAVLDQIEKGVLPPANEVSKYFTKEKNGKNFIKGKENRSDFTKYKTYIRDAKSGKVKTEINTQFREKAKGKIDENYKNARAESNRQAAEAGLGKQSSTLQRKAEQRITEEEARQLEKNLKDSFKKNLNTDSDVTVITDESRINDNAKYLKRALQSILPGQRIYFYESKGDAPAVGVNSGTNDIGILIGDKNGDENLFSMAHTAGHEYFEAILLSKEFGEKFKADFDKIGISDDIKDAYLRFFKESKLANASADAKAYYTDKRIMSEFIQDLGGIWAANMLMNADTVTGFADYAKTLFSTDQNASVMLGTLGMGIDENVTNAMSQLVGFTDKLNEFFENAWLDNLQGNLYRESSVDYSIGTGISEEENNDYMQLAKKSNRTEADDRRLSEMVEKAAKANGYDIKAYHGTSNYGFDSFDWNKSIWGLFGRGFYFTEDKSIADTYTNKDYSSGDKQGVYSVYLKSDLELDMDADAVINDWEDAFSIIYASVIDAPDDELTVYDMLISEYLKAHDIGREFTNTDVFHVFENYAESTIDFEVLGDAWREILEAMGYSGMTHIGGLRAGHGKNLHKVHIVFDPSQVKSAENIVYDNDGNVIPLNERFRSDRGGDESWKNNSMRYSIGTGIEDETNFMSTVSNGENTQSEVKIDTKSLKKVGVTLTDEDAKELAENGIEIDSNSGALSYSYRTFPKHKEKLIKKLVEKGYDKDATIKWLDDMTSICAFILNDIMHNGESESHLYYANDERFSWMKKNSDYSQGSVDANNNCPKREIFTEIFDAIQKEFPNYEFRAEDYEALRALIQLKGFVVTCGFCFVEDRRQKLGEIAQQFIDQLTGKATNKNGEFLAKKHRDKLITEKFPNGDPYIPTHYDLITYEGNLKLYQEHQGVYNAFISFNNARGQAAGRLLEGMAEYNGQILGWNEKTVKSKNNKGGLRIFSLSDADPRYILDLMQIISDASMVGLKIQGYTKKSWFANMVKDCGVMLLRSHIPSGVGYKTVNGKEVLIYDTTEGIDNTSKEFFDADGYDSIGNNVIGISDHHIALAMLDPYIHQIIPFHTGIKGEVLEQKHIDFWNNYRNFQADKAVKPETDKNGKPKKVTQVNIYKDVIEAWAKKGKPITNAREFVEAYLEVCRRRKLIPRFAQFLNVKGEDRTGDVNSFDYDPASFEKYYDKFEYREGYEKFLVDYKLFSADGSFIQQEAVKANFDADFLKDQMNKYIGEKNERKQLSNEFKSIAKEFIEKNMHPTPNDDSVPNSNKVRDLKVDEQIAEEKKKQSKNSNKKSKASDFGYSLSAPSQGLRRNAVTGEYEYDGRPLSEVHKENYDLVRDMMTETKKRNSLSDRELLRDQRNMNDTMADVLGDSGNVSKAYDRALRDTQRRAENAAKMEEKKHNTAMRHAQDRIDRRDERIRQLGDKIKDERILAKLHERFAVKKTKDTIEYRQTRDKLRGNIKSKASELRKWMVAPNEKNHIPLAVVNPLNDFLQGIDPQYKPGSKVEAEQIAKLASLQAVVDKINDHNPDIDDDDALTAAFPQELKDALSDLKDTLEKQGRHNIKDLDNNELRVLDATISVVMASIRDANKLHGKMRYETVSKIGDETVNEGLANKRHFDRSTKVGRAADKLVNIDMMDTDSFGHRLGAGAEKITDSLYEGEEKYEGRIKEAQGIVRGLMEKFKLNGRQLLKTYKDDIHKIKLQSGEEVGLSTLQCLNIYLLSLREQARSHLFDENGGICVARTNNKENKHYTNHEFKLAEADVDEMKKFIPNNLLDFGRAIQEYLSTDISAWGNEVSQELWMFDMYGFEDFYWPIISAKGNFETPEPEITGYGNNVLHQSFTNATKKGANTSLMIGSAADVFNEHIAKMAAYNALAIPINDALKWFNYKEITYRDVLDDNGNPVIGKDGKVKQKAIINRNRSVKTAITNTFGSEGNNFFIQLIKDANGYSEGSIGTDIPNLIVGNAKKVAVAFKLRSAVQQFTSVFKASYLVNPKYMTHWDLSLKDTINEMKELSDLAWWKANGNFDIGTGKRVQNILMGNAGFMDELDEASMSMSQLSDDFGWAILWNGVKNMVSDRHGNDSNFIDTDSYWEEVNKTFSKVINSTQVIDTVLHRPQIMRSKDSLVKQSTAFQSENIRSYNIIRNAIWDVTHGRQGAKKRLFTSSLSFAASAVAHSIVLALYDSLRNRRKEDEFLETYWSNFKSSLVDDVNLFKTIPFLNQAIEIYNGYDAARMDLGSISDLYDAVSAVYNTVINGKDTTFTNYGLISTLLKAVSSVTGIPVNGILSSGEAIVNAVFPGVADIRKPSKNQERKAAMVEYGIAKNVASEFIKNVETYGLSTNASKAMAILSTDADGDGRCDFSQDDIDFIMAMLGVKESSFKPGSDLTEWGINGAKSRLKSGGITEEEYDDYVDFMEAVIY